MPDTIDNTKPDTIDIWKIIHLNFCSCEWFFNGFSHVEDPKRFPAISHNLFMYLKPFTVIDFPLGTDANMYWSSLRWNDKIIPFGFYAVTPLILSLDFRHFLTETIMKFVLAILITFALSGMWQIMFFKFL